MHVKYYCCFEDRDRLQVGWTRDSELSVWPSEAENESPHVIQNVKRQKAHERKMQRKRKIEYFYGRREGEG